MSNLISYLAHLGIVRVLSVPAVMGVMIYITYALAAPPRDIDGEDESA